MPMKYRSLLAMGQRQIAFEASIEGKKGGDDAAAAAAAAAETAAAETAAAEAEAAAATAAATAAAEAEAAAAAAAAAENPESKATDAEKAALLREVMDKKAKLTAATAALDAYEGVDPAKVKALIAAEAAAEQAAAEAKGDFDRVKKMMADQHTADTKKLQDQIDALKSGDTTKSKIIDDLTIGNSFGTSTYISENLTLSPAKARVIYGSHFEVVDGVTVAYDKPASDTSRTQLVDASGTPVGFEAALKRIVDADPDKKTLLKANVLPGSKSKSDGPGGKPAPKTDGLYGVSRIAATLHEL